MLNDVCVCVSGWYAGGRSSLCIQLLNTHVSLCVFTLHNQTDMRQTAGFMAHVVSVTEMKALGVFLSTWCGLWEQVTSRWDGGLHIYSALWLCLCVFYSVKSFVWCFSIFWACEVVWVIHVHLKNTHKHKCKYLYKSLFSLVVISFLYTWVYKQTAFKVLKV